MEAPRIERIEVSAYRVPTEGGPESDGTAEWDHTTLVVAEPVAGGQRGIGYTYADTAAARVIEETLGPRLLGAPAFALPEAHRILRQAVRNLGNRGIAAMALSAVDVALWDLKAKLLGVSLGALLGAFRAGAPGYGSGGFTSYTPDRLSAQLGGWAAEGFSMVKMKVGRDPVADPARVRAAREATGPGVSLFVDANGGYDAKQALSLARVFADLGVSWFEEPVSSDDLAGLRLIRRRAPAGMDIAAGEYGYEPGYFRAMLAAGAVDVLQADVTRCGGITGFLAAAALAEAHHLPLSAHCAPTEHAHLGAATPGLRHLEVFHDHLRVERLLLDGAARIERGVVLADSTRPGLGITLRGADAARWRV
jgi:L-alanine-DL-glutamate epimerase-like enolase superfamily enzyme